jgi:trans-aconitate 2-methyltransferase
MPWDPDHYLRYADHRARPGLELIARIPDVEAATVVDLGCGPGNLTVHLAQRWPEAEVTGIDSSAEMVDRAAADHPGLRWEQGDVATWEPAGPVDVIFSNATLHWLDDHEVLFPRLRSHLRAGGVLAVQMPDNWGAPTHRVPAEVLDDSSWPPRAADALLRDRLASPGQYRSWLQPGTVDVWRTTYYQALTGDDPVWAWTTGSVLRPVLDVLDDGDRERFTAECQARYRRAYPPDAEGVTILPFSRLFMIVVVT